MIKVYGIPNCDTMKQARRWLEANGVEYEFHDYNKSGVPANRLKQWVSKASWETLLNRRGTTWRKLDESVRNGIDEAAAISVMLAHPSSIKRPVLEAGKLLLIGFNEAEYRKLL